MSPAHESNQTLNRAHQETEQMSITSNIHRTILAGVSLFAALLLIGLAASTAKADFGIVDFDGTMLDSSGDPFTQAGGHPDVVSTEFEFTVKPDPQGSFFPIPDGQMKDVVVDLPAGVVGDTSASETKCTAAELISGTPGVGDCPAASRVGDLGLMLSFGVVAETGLYNMVAQPGQVAQFGANAVIPVQLGASVRANDFGLAITARNIPQPISANGVITDFWGVPADHGSAAQRKPLLRTPTSCTGPLDWGLMANAWEDPNTFLEASFLSHDLGGTPIGNTGCENVPFDPTVNSQPTSSKADSPTGLSVDISLPTDGIKNPDGVSQADLKDVTMTFPEGMAVNPSAADGLGACSEDQIALGIDQPASCPDNSKIGTVEMTTPVLDETLTGHVFQAEQDNNPFDSTLAVYINAVNEERGLDIKLAGKISPDPDTGQLVATFDDNPQLPLENMHLTFKSGSRAPLVTPPTCGTYDIVTELTPWSAADPDNPTPDEIVTQTSSFVIDKGPDGGACKAGDPNQPGDPADLADRPFEPTMNAGVTNPVGGAFTPFTFQLKRPDGHQEIRRLRVDLPPGVTANISDTPRCSEAALAELVDSNHSAAEEIASAKCPAASQVGKVTVGAGAGSNPYYVQTGKAYLAGPYKGAPLSLAAVVPALAGPFDLGVELVRSALHVDPRTAEITVATDQFPTILEGIPLRLRDIRVNMNKPNFMLAGTNCDPLQITGQASGVGGASADLAQRYQLGDCGSLGFSPELKLDLGNAKKSTKRNQHPPLHATLSPNEGDANISSAEVVLPEGVLLDQDRIGRICSRDRYAAGTCPEESRVGYAKATTPLLADPVEGPVYLKASDNTLPDLAADLNGEIDIDLFGRIDQTKGKRINRIRNTFDIVPDVPVSSFELTLDGGSDGLLVNSRNICAAKLSQKVSIDLRAHNEMRLSESPLIGSACEQMNKKKAKKLKRKAKKLLRKAKRTDSKRKAKQLRKQARKLKKQARKLGR